jgi:hypothetical protein
MVDGDVMGDEPAWHGGRLGNIAMLALAGWGFATPDRTVQKIVASMTMIVFVALIVLRFWSPR